MSETHTPPQDHITITANGKISFDKIPEAAPATLKPYLLQDKRGSEENTYGLVKVANRLWMRENLRAKNWQDGTPIPTGLSSNDWLKATTPAVCVYKNNPDNLATHGALYNAYATRSDKGLAPKDWRVTKDQDWTDAVKYLDPKGYMLDPDNPAREAEKAGLLMKSTTGWKMPPNPEPGVTLKQGNNLSGLDIRPTGSTSTSKYLDYYSGEGHQAYFWTSDNAEDMAEKNSYFRRYFWDQDISNRHWKENHYGYSVRCVIDLAPIQVEDKEEMVFSLTKGGKFTIDIATTNGIVYSVLPGQAPVQHRVSGDYSKPSTLTLDLPTEVKSLTLKGEITGLNCAQMPIEGLDLSKALSLKVLKCDQTQLAHIDVSPCAQLERLLAFTNEKLTKVTLGSKPALTDLFLAECELEEIDLSSATALVLLDLRHNNLTTLDLSAQAALKKLDAQKNKLTEVKLGNCPLLEEIALTKNKLTALDLSHNTALTKLYIGSNKLTALNLAQQSKLEELNCKENQLKALDLSPLSLLKELYLQLNEVPQLALQNCPKLEVLSCSENKLTNLDLSQLSALSSVEASFNAIETVKLAGNAALTALGLSGNKLQELNVSEAPALIALIVDHNLFTAAKAKALFETLPNRTEGKGSLIFLNPEFDEEIAEHNQLDAKDISIANNRGWTVFSGENPIPSSAETLQALQLLQVTPEGFVLASEVNHWQLFAVDGTLLAKGNTHQLSREELPTDGYALLSLHTSSGSVTLKLRK